MKNNQGYFTDRINILGIGVSPINMGIATSTIAHWIEHKLANYVCVTPVHSIMLCFNDPELRQIYNRAGMVTPDGMPVVWLSKASGHPEVSRVYGPDLLLAMCEASEKKGYSHFFYGGAEGVADLLVEKLKEEYPYLNVAGTYCPPFRTLTQDEDDEIVAIINENKPDIVWIGLGAPKQELWMDSHVGRIDSAVLIGIGAAFDFHAGIKKQAPFWIQRSGLEWLFRLMSEPRRLWKRYLVNNPRFVAHVFLQKTGLRHYELN